MHLTKISLFRLISGHGRHNFRNFNVMKGAFATICVIFSSLFLSLPATGQQVREEALADQFFRNGDYQKAAELYKQLYEEDNQQKYYGRLVNALISLKDFTEAEHIIREQLSGAPGDYRYLLDLGNLYKKSGNTDKAKTQFESVLKKLPAETHLVAGIAYTLYNYAETGLAIEALLKGREKSDDPSVLGFELARLYYLDKQPSSMIHELLNLVERKPEYLENIKGQLQFYLRDEKDFILLQEMLEKRIKRDPGNPAYAELLIWRLLQQKQFAEALDLAIDLDKKEGQAQRVLHIAGICSANQAYEVAAKAYKYLIDKGQQSHWYQTARIHFLDAKRKHLTLGSYETSDLLELAKEYEALLQDMGKNGGTAAVMQQLAMLKGQYLDKTPEAIALLEETIALSSGRFQAECKLKLGDLYILADDVWEATLLYGQVEKSFKDNPLGQEAKFRNARLSYYIGEFEWAKGQLDVLKASTSQLMANDALNLSLLISENPGPDSTYGALKMYAGAELLVFRNKLDKAIAVLDSIHIRFPGHALNDDILMAKAEIFIRRNQPGQAAKVLTSVTENYRYDIWADDALFKLGELYETKLKDPAKAQGFYEKLLLEYPGSLYVTEARKRFRTLRGDIPAGEEEEFIGDPVSF